MPVPVALVRESRDLCKQSWFYRILASFLLGLPPTPDSLSAFYKFSSNFYLRFSFLVGICISPLCIAFVWFSMNTAILQIGCALIASKCHATWLFVSFLEHLHVTSYSLLNSKCQCRISVVFPSSPFYLLLYSSSLYSFLLDVDGYRAFVEEKQLMKREGEGKWGVSLGQQKSNARGEPFLRDKRVGECERAEAGRQKRLASCLKLRST